MINDNLRVPDPVKEYLENLRKNNPALLLPENRNMLIESFKKDLKMAFPGGDAGLLKIAEKSGFDISLLQKKKDQTDQGTELPQTSDQKESSSDLSAIQKRSNFISQQRAFEKERLNGLVFSEIDSKFLDRPEGDVKVDLTKVLIGKGFKVNEVSPGSDAIEITAPNGNTKVVELSIPIKKKMIDFFQSKTPTPYKPFYPGEKRPLNEAEIEQAYNVQKNTGAFDGTEKSLDLMTKANEVRAFLIENNPDLVFQYKTKFDKNSTEAAQELFKNTFSNYGASTIEELDSLLIDSNSELKKLKQERDKYAYKPFYPGERPPLNYDENQKKYQDYTKDIEIIESRRTDIINKKDLVSKTLSNLISLSENKEDIDFGFLNRIGLDFNDLKLPNIKLDGAEASFNDIKEILLNDKMRKSIKSGDTSLELSLKGNEHPLIKEIVENAIALNDHQMQSSYLSSIGYELGASLLENMANVEEAVIDTQQAIQSSAFKLIADVDGIDDSDIDTAFQSVYNNKFSSLRKGAEALRSKEMIVEGDMLSSESASEFIFKGSKSAANSFWITLTYLAAPEVGLAMTGMNAYGGSLNEIKSSMEYIKNTGDPEGIYEYDEEMTLGKARAISIQRSVAETALTYAFTYNFLKGISKSATQLKSMKYLEAEKLVSTYSRSFTENLVNISGRSLFNEEIEEVGIILSRMYLDEINGVAEYSGSDYVRAAGNTAVSVPFMALPLSGVAAKNQTSTSRKLVHSLLAKASMDEEVKQDRRDFMHYDFLIKNKQRAGEKVEKEILDERKRLSEKIVKWQNKTISQIKENASDQDIVKVAKKILNLKEKRAQLIAARDENLNKHLSEIVSDLEKEIKNDLDSFDNDKNIEKAEEITKESSKETKGYEGVDAYFDLELRFGKEALMNALLMDSSLEDLISKEKSISEMTEEQMSSLKEKFDYLKDLNNKRNERDSEQIQLRADNPRPEKFKRTAMNAAELLTERINSFKNDYLFKNQEKADELRDYLNRATLESTTKWQRDLIKKMLKTLTNNEAPHVGMDQYYNSLIGNQQISKDVLRARPTSEQIKIITKLESLFVGYRNKKTGKIAIPLMNMAHMNHLFSIVFKNEKMREPVSTLSSIIDANLNRLMNKNDAETADLLNSVDSKKVSKLSSAAEMMIISELIKIPEDTTDDEHVKKVKGIFLSNLDQLAKDKSDRGKERLKEAKDAYDKIFREDLGLLWNPSTQSVEKVDVKIKDILFKYADKDLVSFVVNIAKSFEENTDNTLSMSRDYYGNEPTMYLSYIPTIITNIKDPSSVSRQSNSSIELGGPASMQETFDYYTLKDTDLAFIHDNWFKLVMREKLNAEAEFELRPSIDKLRGFINGKEFESMFDTESNSLGISDESDFDFIKHLMNERLDKINSKIQTRSSSEIMEKNNLQEIWSSVSNFVSATRLASGGMRASQATSAMLATSIIVGTRAKTMLAESMIRFAAGNLTADLSTKDSFFKVFNNSSTSRRGGAEQFKPISELEKTTKRKRRSIGGKVFVAANKLVQGASQTALNVALAQSDKIAGQASWAALYYDRMMQTRGSEIKNMNFDEFWEWSESNIDERAIAWADQQIDRSQMLANQWNNGEAFNNKGLSSVVFMFGRFAYSRKVGMANDWAIINDDQTASEADKSRARKRLASAAIEIGVFKMIQPAVRVTMAAATVGLIASLVGWDEEYDDNVKKYKKSQHYLSTRIDDAKRERFEPTKYELDLRKQFLTSLAEGMIPLPSPSASTELAFSLINKSADKELFNVYSKELRDAMDDEGISPTTKDEVWDIILNNSGIAGMATEDLLGIYNSTIADLGRVPNQYGPEDRWVKPEAIKAVKVINKLRLSLLIFPSADVRAFIRELEGIISRKYTTTKKPDYKAYEEEQRKKKREQ